MMQCVVTQCVVIQCVTAEHVEAYCVIAQSAAWTSVCVVTVGHGTKLRVATKGRVPLKASSPYGCCINVEKPCSVPLNSWRIMAAGGLYMQKLPLQYIAAGVILWGQVGRPWAQCNKPTAYAGLYTQPPSQSTISEYFRRKKSMLYSFFSE